MKRRHLRTLEAIERVDGGVVIRDIEALVRALGGTVQDRGNGSYEMELSGRVLVHHRPNARPEIGRGFAGSLRVYLLEVGIINR